MTVSAAPRVGGSDTLVNMFVVNPPPGAGPTEVDHPCPAPDEDQSCAETVVEGLVPSPQLTLSKTVNLSTAAAGDTLVHTIEVLNTGNTVEGFTATDMLPPDVTFVPPPTTTLGSATEAAGVVMWTVPNPPGLAPGANAEMTITATVASTAEATTQTNRVTLPPPPGGTTVVDPETECDPAVADTACAETVVPGVPRLTQDKTVDMATGVAGDHLTYALTVANHGTASALDVVAHDTLPPTVTFVSATPDQGTFDQTTGTWKIGTVAVGQTVTLTVVVSVDPAAEASTLVNMFQVEAPEGGEDITVGHRCPSPDQQASCAETVVPGVLRLTQNKAVDLLQAPVGGTLTYTMTIANPAPPSTAPAMNVIATDRLPAGVTVVSSTASQGTFDPATGVWSVGTLDVNATATLAIVATINAATELTVVTNAFVVDPPQGGPPPEVENPCVDIPGGSCASTEVLGVPQLAQNKTVDKETAVVGDTVTYTITIVNEGTGDASPVVATDTAPPGVTLVSATPSTGTFDASTGTWSIPALRVAAAAHLTLVVIVNPEAAGQTLTNRLAV